MKQFNYRASSLIIVFALLMITGSSNVNTLESSNMNINNIQTSEQSKLALVPMDNHLLNYKGSPLDSIQTNAFEPYWMEKTPLLSPTARTHSAMAYDSFNDKVILFGGINGSVSDMLGDTWAYDYTTNSWEEMKPIVAPPATWKHAMVYDPVIQKIVMFGGAETFTDTWTYDYETNEWEQQFPAVSPSFKLYHSMVYDTNRRKIILIGGNTAPFETWEMDSTTFNWTNLSPVTPLPLLFAFAASYDEANDKIIVFGGQNSSTAINAGETYAYDYSSNEWTLLNPLVDPTDRRFYGRPMGYDILSQKSVFFGGYSDKGVSKEVWSFDYSTTTWELISLIDLPTARWIHTMVFSSNSNKFIMFGGTDGELSDQTFELTISDSDSPIILSPDDLTVEFGSVDVIITWDIIETDPKNYTIEKDGIEIEISIWLPGSPINIDISGLEIGTYNFNLIVYDFSGNSASDEVIVYVVDTTSPVILGPVDLELFQDDLGIEVQWILHDLDPDYYTLTRNNTEIQSSNWVSDQIISITIENLEVGLYKYSLTATDGTGNIASDELLVIILPPNIPSISGPADMYFVQGDINQRITWYISDNNPTFYILEVNQQVITNSTWVALPFIEIPLQDYINGYYNFTLTLFDANNNKISDTVFIQILPTSPQTSSPTPPSSSTPSIPQNVFYGAISAIGVLSIFMIIKRVRGL